MTTFDRTNDNAHNYGGLPLLAPVAESADATDLKSNPAPTDNDTPANNLAPDVRGAAKRQPSKNAPAYTYFIQSLRGGPVKIGRAVNVATRLAMLQCGNPDELAVVAVIVGDHERVLHERFRDNRISGEWFKPTGDLHTFVCEAHLKSPRVGVRLHQPAGYAQYCRLGRPAPRGGSVEHLDAHIRQLIDAAAASGEHPRLELALRLARRAVPAAGARRGQP